MKILNLKTVALVATSVLLFGCDDDSDRVGSSGLSAGQFWSSFIVVDDGSNDIYAEAQLTKGAPPTNNSEDDFYIDLEYGDSLWIANGDESLQALDLEENLFDEVDYHKDKYARFRSANDIRDEVYFLFIWEYIIEWGTYYSATYDRPEQEVDTYTVTLARDRGDDLYDSSVVMPEAFDIIMPSNGSSFDRENDGLEILWDNVSGANYQVQITASTTCLDGSFDEFTDTVTTDTGSYIFTPGELDSPIFDGNCSTSITVAKVRFGTLNASFSGGLIQAQQARRLTLSSLDN